MAIDESFMDLTDRITQVESEASRPDEVVEGKDDDNDETGNWCKQMDESKWEFKMVLWEWTGMRNLVIDLLKRFDGHRTNPSP